MFYLPSEKASVWAHIQGKNEYIFRRGEEGREIEERKM